MVLQIILNYAWVKGAAPVNTLCLFFLSACTCYKNCTKNQLISVQVPAKWACPLQSAQSSSMLKHRSLGRILRQEEEMVKVNRAIGIHFQRKVKKKKIAECFFFPKTSSENLTSNSKTPFDVPQILNNARTRYG